MGANGRSGTGDTGDPAVGDLCHRLNETEDFAHCCEAFYPTEKPYALPWACENLVSDTGRPYDHAAYPHLGALGGPWDAFDADFVRTIALMFGSRLGKTFFGQCGSLFVAANDPAPMMHANATETLCKQVLERTYEMIKRRSTLRELMASRHEKDWRQDTLEFRLCKLFGAWARSVSTLADKDIKFGHAGEIDKWEQSATSREADPLALFTDRFKNYQSVRKTLLEGTPTVKGRSRIETAVLAGSHCQLHVPCVHCRKFQVLIVGSEAERGGLKFQRAAHGRTDPAQAYATAHYVCRLCQGNLGDHDRSWMIRRGVWVPAGCRVDDAKAIKAAEQRMTPLINFQPWKGWKNCDWILGTPDRDGPDQSYQLSSLYALSLSWGDIAQEFAKCHDKPQLLRNFVNQWKAETWEARKSKSTPELLGARIGTTRPAKLVPLWARVLTVTIDRQAADGGCAVCDVLAHGPEDRSAVIFKCERPTLQAAWDDVCRIPYPHEDKGAPLLPAVVGIDSGWDTKATYEFCNAHPGCIAIKGSDGDLGGQPYQLVTLGDNGGKNRTGANGQALLHVATDFWETDLQHRLEDRLANEPGSLSLYAEAAHDLDWINELLNAQLTDRVDTRGNARLLWVKRHENAPNDHRDAVRYGLCLIRAWLDANGQEFPARGAEEQLRAIQDERRTADDRKGMVRELPRSGWIRRS